MPVHLSEGWRRVGCTVHEFFYGTHMGRDWSAAGRKRNADTNARLLELARRLKANGELDLVFAVIYDDVLAVETAKSLQTLGVPMVNYHVDLFGQWYRVLRTGRYFDRVACAQEARWEPMARAGIRPYLMPMAANPLAGESVIGTDGETFHGIVYMGSPWPYRRQVLEELMRRGMPLRIYGHNWLHTLNASTRLPQLEGNTQPLAKAVHDARHYLLPRIRAEGLSPMLHVLKRRLTGSPRQRPAQADILRPALCGRYAPEEFPALVRTADINLGFTHFGGVPESPGESRQMRLRDFEIPMAGGFYLTQRCAEISSMFEEGKNVVCWDGIGDLVDKVRFYLENAGVRRAIAAAGRLHCEAHHTWERRFRGLLGELGLRPPLPAS